MYSRVINDKERNLYNIIILIEILLSVAIFFTAISIRKGLPLDQFDYTREYQLVLLIMIFSWFFLLRTRFFQRFYRTKTLPSIFIDYIKGISIGALILVGVIFVFNLETISRSFILIFIVMDLIGLFIFRMVVFETLKVLRARGKNQKYLMVIGDESVDKIIKQIYSHPEWGYRVDRIMSNSPEISKKYGSFLSVEPIHSDTRQNRLNEILDEQVIDEVIYCRNRIDRDEYNDVIESCEEIGVRFLMQPDFWNHGKQYQLSNMGDLTFFTPMDKSPDYFLELIIKNILDYSFAIFWTVLFAPLIPFMALAIKLDSPGPVLFKQKRVGLRGRQFYVYKFRTMVNDAEKLRARLEGQNEMDGPVFKIKGDPRVTRIGSFLRKTGLDELPQLINVLKGEMSFVGPRPPIPSEVEEYERWQLRRLSIKPGITCIWQITPNRNEIPFNQWMKLDMQYIDSWSLKLDFLVIMWTIRAMLSGSGR